MFSEAVKRYTESWRGVGREFQGVWGEEQHPWPKPNSIGALSQELEVVSRKQLWTTGNETLRNIKQD